MLIYGWKDQQNYVQLAWFIYRHFTQNPQQMITDRLKRFYSVLDAYFMKKYRLETEEKTKENILSLFKYESERHFVINELVIEDAISNYESTPELLS